MTAIPSDEILIIHTPRLTLEPVTTAHCKELCELLLDPKLHEYVSLDPPTSEEQRERCLRWSGRRSPEGKEIWLNWAARETASQKIVAQLQVAITEENIATLGYVVAVRAQRRGFASEAMSPILALLRKHFRIRAARASTDSRNVASHRLARKLGMIQADCLTGHNTLRDGTSDELVFALSYE